MPGELRWFATLANGEIEVDSGTPYEHDGETIQPLSRTFIPARLEDNPHQNTPEYRAILQSLPEPLRSQLLYGDFTAGSEPDPWQVIPTAWVQAAQARWVACAGPTVPMTAIGLDVAHGGKDQTVIAARYGPFIDRLHKFPGKTTPDGKSAAAEVVKIAAHGAYINVDAIGYGASAAERLADAPPEGYGLTAYPINVAMKSEFTDRSGKYRMVNLRAEMYWRLREDLDPEHGAELMLPPDPELLADLCAPTYRIATSGIQIEEKGAISARIGRSPDAGDAVALSVLPAPRRRTLTAW